MQLSRKILWEQFSRRLINLQKNLLKYGTKLAFLNDSHNDIMKKYGKLRR